MRNSALNVIFEGFNQYAFSAVHDFVLIDTPGSNSSDSLHELSSLVCEFKSLPIWVDGRSN